MGVNGCKKVFDFLLRVEKRYVKTSLFTETRELLLV